MQYKVAPAIQVKLSIHLLHIADATAEALQQDGISRVGLLGTRFTMEQAFYKSRLVEQFGLDVLVPNEADRTLVHEVIYQELCQGIISASSRNQYLAIIDKLYQDGAQAVILGCTEIALLVSQEHTHVPLYDTTRLHAQAAVAFTLGA